MYGFLVKRRFTRAGVPGILHRLAHRIDEIAQIAGLFANELIYSMLAFFLRAPKPAGEDKIVSGRGT